MSVYDYQAAFGAADVTSQAMRTARQQWRQLYYGEKTQGEDPCQHLAYTIVSKLTKAVFGEYQAAAPDPAAQAVLQAMEGICRESFGCALVEGECFLKPVPQGQGFRFVLVPRSNVLVFQTGDAGVPTDLGMTEKSVWADAYYTLLERRTVDEQGYLTIRNTLYRSASSDKLGQPVALQAHPAYGQLPQTYTYPQPVGSVGLVRLKLPMLNCVDGSQGGVAVYAAAADLIHNIDCNESQLCGEFSRGESRIIASKDMLDGGQLKDHLFVGLNDDPEAVGITVFSPPLRCQAYLQRKQEYLRNVESIVGLRRGMLSDANVEDRTATEIASSTADFNLTVMELQGVWQDALRQAVALCARLAGAWGLQGAQDTSVSVDWGNGVLYDEQSQWEAYVQMVQAGLLKPEVALGWRFNMPADTQDQLAAIRAKYMP